MEVVQALDEKKAKKRGQWTRRDEGTQKQTKLTSKSSLLPRTC